MALGDGTLSPVEPREHHTSMAGPLSARAGIDQRAARILAKSIYKEARVAGMEEQAVIAVATELLGLVAADMKAARE